MTGERRVGHEAEETKEADEVNRPLRILSLGAGVQSSTLLLMACEGELRIDGAIFADTGWEPAAVYTHLAWLEAQATAAGIPIYRVSDGNIRANALDPAHRFASMPLYQRNADGSKGMARRQCTNEYKLKPIRRQLRALGATRKHPVVSLIGISLDEYTRMRDSDVQYVQHAYPLVDLRMTRGDCLTWLAERGYPEPQKSACIGCPYRRNKEWRQLSPEEFADAVDFDHQIRDEAKGSYWRGERFLHDSLVPLDLVDLRSEQDRGQMDMFDGDGCGVLCATEEAA